jgi:hypothetical protein
MANWFSSTMTLYTHWTAYSSRLINGKREENFQLTIIRCNFPAYLWSYTFRSIYSSIFSRSRWWCLRVKWWTLKIAKANPKWREKCEINKTNRRKSSQMNLSIKKSFKRERKKKKSFLPRMPMNLKQAAPHLISPEQNHRRKHKFEWKSVCFRLRLIRLLDCPKRLTSVPILCHLPT